MEQIKYCNFKWNRCTSECVYGTSQHTENLNITATINGSLLNVSCNDAQKKMTLCFDYFSEDTEVYCIEYNKNTNNSIIKEFILNKNSNIDKEILSIKPNIKYNKESNNDIINIKNCIANKKYSDELVNDWTNTIFRILCIEINGTMPSEGFENIINEQNNLLNLSVIEFMWGFDVNNEDPSSKEEDMDDTDN